MIYENDDYRGPEETDSLGLAVIVPPETLQTETLRALAVEFLLREQGNDISESGVTEERITRVLQALKRKSHFITFDPRTESAGIIDAKDLRSTAVKMPS